jgi:carboxymethylenebutenolidase
MNRLIRSLAWSLSALALLVVTPAARAGTMTEITSGSEQIQAYVALPQGAAKNGPAVVVIQEWWGLTDWVKASADRIAGMGFVAIAPDLYRGQVAADPELAHELMRGLPDERAIRDVRAAAAYAKSAPGGGVTKVGVIGFCMGGRMSLLASLDKGPFDATVICYGSPETNPDRLKTLRGPVLGIFGGADRGLGADQTEALTAGLKKAGKKGEVITYPGAQHGFLNDSRPAQYDSVSAPKAWEQITGFLAANLGK